MKKLFASLFLIGLSVSSFPAQAQTKRIYFAGYAGFSLMENFDFSENTTPSSGQFEPQNAPTFAGALGLRINRNFRMEAELAYNSADIDSANVNGTGATPVDGDISTTTLFLNGYYDFDVRGWKTQPYLTAGLGVGHHDGQITDPGSFTNSVNDTGYSFLWNVGTGVKYRVKDNFAWTAGYRYIDGSSFDLGGTDIDYSNHEFRVGLEWDLGY